MEQQLFVRLRADLKDLSDEEFNAYLESMDLDSSLDVLNTINALEESATPKRVYNKTYKTITIRGVKKRIPVGHYVEEKVTEIADMPRGDGSPYLCTLLGFGVNADFIESMEQDDRSFSILIGFTRVGDLVEVDGMWGVVSTITDNMFTMKHVCGTLETITSKLHLISQNYRMVG
jgi:hypothetical protein